MRTPRLRGAAPALVMALAMAMGAPALAAGKAPREPVPVGVTIRATDQDMAVYADRQSRTLYTWTGDKVGQSACGDDRYETLVNSQGHRHYVPDYLNRPTCEQEWPPLPAPAGARPVGHWSIIQRKDGTSQWAYKGWPVYRSTMDQAPGDVNGVAMAFNSLRVPRNPVTAPFEAPPGVTTTITKQGRAFAVNGGVSALYMNARSAMTAANCGPDWRPFLAPALARPVGDWAIARDPSGRGQWTYKGRPVFTSTLFRHGSEELTPQDEKAGWTPALAQAHPVLPAGFQVTATPAGDAYADRDGRTLYIFDCAEEAPDTLFCDGATPIHRLTLCGGPERCNREWRRVPAAKGAKSPNRLWTVIQVDPATGMRVTRRKGAESVWAYRGRPLYTYVGDVAPGDANGDSVMIFNIGQYVALLVNRGKPQTT